MIRKQGGMVERLGRRERIEKGSREGIEKETRRQFEEKEGLRDPPLLEFLDPTLRCSHVTPHTQRERGKVIDRGVHIYVCGQKKI